MVNFNVPFTDCTWPRLRGEIKGHTVTRSFTAQLYACSLEKTPWRTRDVMLDRSTPCLRSTITNPNFRSTLERIEGFDN